MPTNPKLNLILCNKNILAGQWRGQWQWRGEWRGQWRGGYGGGRGPRRRGGRRSRAAIARRSGGASGVLDPPAVLEIVLERIMTAYEMHQQYYYN